MRRKLPMHTLWRAAVAALLLAGPYAHSVVSDRHLQGVRALECDLESSPAEFKLLVNIKEHTLQLEEQVEKIPYQEISDSKLRFRLQQPGAPVLTCELELPAGSLVCTRPDGSPEVGFCLTVQ